MSLPVQVQMPVSMGVSLPWVNVNCVPPVVAMPMIHYAYQTYVAPNVNVAFAANSIPMRDANIYANEQIRYL